MAEGDLFDPVWASEGDIVVPTAAQIRRGFECGTVSPGLFNWLFQTLESTLNSIGVADIVRFFRKIDTTEGLSGGGDLTTDRTLRLNLPGLEAKTDASSDDILVVYDPVSSKHKRTTRGNFLSGIGGGGGDISGGENVGAGDGTVYKAVNAGLLQLRKLKNVGGLVISNNGDDVEFSLADLGSELTVE